MIETSVAPFSRPMSGVPERRQGDPDRLGEDDVQEARPPGEAECGRGLDVAPVDARDRGAEGLGGVRGARDGERDDRRLGARERDAGEDREAEVDPVEEDQQRHPAHELDVDERGPGERAEAGVAEERDRNPERAGEGERDQRDPDVEPGAEQERVPVVEDGIPVDLVRGRHRHAGVRPEASERDGLSRRAPAFSPVQVVYGTCTPSVPTSEVARWYFLADGTTHFFHPLAIVWCALW